jgi:trk system potassium uptake protein TrkA
VKIIIIGAGEVGFHIAKRLASEAKEVVVVDNSPRALKRISEGVDVQTIEGSGSNPAVLEDAGIRDADIMLAVTDSDEINIVACTFAAALAPGAVTLARIRKDEYLHFQEGRALEMLGIAKAINPDVEVVRTIERLIDIPGAEEISDFAGGRIKFVGYRVAGGPAVGVGMVDIRSVLGVADVIIAAIVRDDQLIIPSGGDVIENGDLVYFVCFAEHTRLVMQRLGCPMRQVRNVMIIGGGDIGLRLARSLEDRLHVKLVDIDPDRCQELAQELRKTLVLLGDGRDQDLLAEENIQDMDMAISLTGDEETNILTALLCRRLGAGKAVTRINKFAYFNLVRAVGIEQIVSPRLAAVNSILQYMRKGKVLSATTIKGDEAEALEAVALAHSDIVGKAIRDLNLPRGALILSIQRGDEVLFPTGDSVIMPDDRILILSTRRNIPRVEKSLTVKLEFF